MSGLDDYKAREKSAKERFPNEDPVHVMSLDKKGANHDLIFKERDAFYEYRQLLGELGYGMTTSKLPDGGPSYWCGGLGCMSDAELGYVERQVAKGVSFVKLLQELP
jgi:hypothetical protein